MPCENGKSFFLPVLSTRSSIFSWRIPTMGNASDNQRRLQGFLPRMNDWRFFVVMTRQAFEQIARAAAGITAQKGFIVMGSQLEERAARTSNHKIFPPGPVRPCRLASSPSPGARRHRRLDLSNHAVFPCSIRAIREVIPFGKSGTCQQVSFGVISTHVHSRRHLERE